LIINGNQQAPVRVVAHGANWFEVDGALPPSAQVNYTGAFFFDTVTVRGLARVDKLGETLVTPGGPPMIEAGSELW
jgi:hypothetical protein